MFQADIEVSETIVLPSKNRSDRLDFTQKWLANDIKSWADNSTTKPDLLLNSTTKNFINNKQQKFEHNDIMGNDSDEHSLGSCSAEVAAINNGPEKRKKRETPDLIKSVKNAKSNQT